MSLATSAIYLTIGNEAYDVTHQWSGCHITMAGFHPSHNEEAFMRKIPQILEKNSAILKGWRPKNIKIEKWGRHWTVIFSSETLNIITRELDRHGFKKIKGPEYAKRPFHMVLKHLKTQEAAENYLKTLKDKTWFITIVKKEPSAKNYNWFKHHVL